MKKKLFTLALALCLLCLLPFAVEAADIVDSGSCGDNATWTVYNDKSMVISGTGDVNSTPWKESYSTIYSLTVEQGITNLPWQAFSNMPKLTTVKLPNTLTAIPNGCFSLDSSLTTIEIPNSVLWIDESAFNGCSALTAIVIPDSVTDVDIGGSFMSCGSLREITIGKGVTNISNDHEFDFYEMNSLESFNVSLQNEHYTSVDGVLFTKDMKTLVKFPSAKTGSYTIPDGVETITKYAFFGAEGLTDIHVPATVTTMDLDVRRCPSLATFHVDENNAKLASYDGILYNKAKTVLLKCAPGKEGRAELAPGLWEIKEAAFYDCAKITEVIIPDTVEAIGGSAFNGCSSLKYLVIPDSVTSWGQFAFNNCQALEWIAFCVKNEEFYEDFGSCHNLQNVYYYGSEADWNTLKISGFDWAVTNATKHYNSVKPGTYAISYELGGGTNNTANPATYFNYADPLTLAEPTLDGKFFDGWFQDAAFTTPVGKEFPKRGYTEGDKTFYARWLNSPEEHEHVYIENECYCGTAFGTIGNTITWTLSRDGVLTLSGSGVFAATSDPDYDCPWNDYREAIKKIVIEDGITEIGRYAFSDLTMLTEVVIADSVTTIDNGAFWGCSGLVDVDLGEGVQSIHNGAFWGCSSLEEITIPKSVTFMGYGVFSVDFYGEVLEECNLKSVRFEGSAPAVEIVEYEEGFTKQSIFSNTEAPITIYHPMDDATWTEEAKTTFGGNLVWETYCEHAYTTAVTAPTCTDQGFTTYTCDLCGDSHVDDYVDATGHTAGEWIADEQKHWHACGCGEILDVAEHTYADDADAECDICGYIRTVVVPGNVDGNDSVDYFDAMLVIQYFTGLTDENAVNVSAADVDGSGNVDFFDAMYILQYFAGIITEFPKAG